MKMTVVKTLDCDTIVMPYCKNPSKIVQIDAANTFIGAEIFQYNTKLSPQRKTVKQKPSIITWCFGGTSAFKLYSFSTFKVCREIQILKPNKHLST
ncbi:hypothetical protein XENTR_v10016465 [Xenopus tropicalis]|nr:hypothetical protein XENTR_v10016465 [Xenopus tropicalis]